jgi:uncharacterized protein
MKVVLDTNTLLVSVSTRSPFYPIYKALKEGRYELVVATDILLEYEEVIGDEMGMAVAQNLTSFLSDSPYVLQVTRYYNWYLIKADPDDDKFVDVAIAANADFIVTDDKHFRILKKLPFPKVKVISTEAFLRIITASLN